VGHRGFRRSQVTTQQGRQKVIGIDPGLSKCGYAAMYEDGVRVTLEVVPTADLAARLDRDVRAGDVSAICVGDATTSDTVVRLCRERWPEVPVAVVDERNTTFEARRLYYEEHPPRGFWRFVPRGMLLPPVPLDDYAALLIIERFRRRRS